MGMRGRTESVTAVLAAFIGRKRWSQAELARKLELSTPAVRKILQDMERSGLEISSHSERPHVYWTLKKDWVPGAVYFKDVDVSNLLRLLRRLPASKERDHLLRSLVDQLPVARRLDATPPVVSRLLTEQEERHIPVIEDAAARRKTLWMKYASASSRRSSDRHVSVHLVEIGPPSRFVATCHNSGELRWFRVESIFNAHVDDKVAFRPCAPEEVQAYRGASLDGFKGDGPAVEYSFFVRDPESSWVANNLLEGMHVESRHGGIVVTTKTSALVRLARYVVALGVAARPDGRALAQAVATIAAEALEQARMVLEGDERAEDSAGSRDATARPRSDV